MMGSTLLRPVRTKAQGEILLCRMHTHNFTAFFHKEIRKEKEKYNIMLHPMKHTVPLSHTHTHTSSILKTIFKKTMAINECLCFIDVFSALNVNSIQNAEVHINVVERCCK